MRKQKKNFEALGIRPKLLESNNELVYAAPIEKSKLRGDGSHCSTLAKYEAAKVEQIRRTTEERLHRHNQQLLKLGENC